MPRGLEDVSKFPDLVAELINRDWTEEEVKGAIGKNLLRVFTAVEQVHVRDFSVHFICIYVYCMGGNPGGGGRGGRTPISQVLVTISNYKKHPLFRVFSGNLSEITAKNSPLSRENGNMHAVPSCIRVGGRVLPLVSYIVTRITPLRSIPFGATTYTLKTPGSLI